MTGCSIRKTRSVIPAVFIFVIFFLTAFISSAQAPDGKILFETNCKQCHSTGDNKVIGPGLKGVEDRVPSEEWLLKWVKNSTALIKAGDEYGNKIFKENGGVAMPAQSLKDDEIKAILAYTKAEAAKIPAQITSAVTAAKAEEKEGPWLLITVVVILGILAVVLNRVQKGLKNAVLIKEGKPIPEPIAAKPAIKIWIRGNKKLIAVLLVLFTCWSSWKGWYALAGIGISQGYQPEQPIKFPHKLHAGKNKINCQYCHSGAEKGKTAGIPSANVCMNCHKYIQEGPVYGKEEIAKIYAALDYDPATQKYGTNTKPIQWIRIHNLPDLAYFNHSQHVVVGKIECQTCHGPVQEMDTLKQFSQLTMGWCIDCHRTTEVKMEGNGYYTDYHKKLIEKYGPEAKLTVEKIGGTECSRCHY
ncbi:MAG TPA: c-type cytochrome [Bacteroidia bacterium]|nr:c-type cytochrome [Bacteroidia bacterium]